MDERQELAEQYGMTKEYVDWFFDNKKDTCGNLWLTMLGAMWEGWQASRSAIELKAPESISTREALDAGYSGDYAAGRDGGLEDWEKTIRAAGLKVKE